MRLLNGTFTKPLLRPLFKPVLIASILTSSVSAYADFNHSSWDRLLDQHVTMTNGGKASKVNYNGMKADQAALAQYLNATSKVSKAAFNQWSKDEQLAFLINVYNACTVELVLTRYPNIKSIKDIGSLLRSPWKQDVALLFGKKRSLDDIEHSLIRGSDRYNNDPRIHFAVNCASIGCPALQDYAFTGSKLEGQLEQVTVKFLADRSRNRLRGDKLEVSPIFKWYKKDFEQGWRGTHSVGKFLARYSKPLGLSPSQAHKVKQGNLKISYTAYDWNLNKQ